LLAINRLEKALSTPGCRAMGVGGSHTQCVGNGGMYHQEYRHVTMTGFYSHMPGGQFT